MHIFNQNITYHYACRKRLADGRARVKGRFVSNSGSGGNEDDIAAHEPPSMTSTLVNNNDNSDAAATRMVPVPEWWPEMQEGLACRDEIEISMSVNLHLCDANDMELIAAYVGVSSIDLCAYLHRPPPPSP
uniref:CCT domain-containing protein n=1 Tax=Leersia perrieri TaxID=77586 RepID=A0A0D9XN21_9ORYZ